MSGTQFGKGCHLHLIDGSAFIFRAYHALPPLTRKSDGLPIGAVWIQRFTPMKALTPTPSSIRRTSFLKKIHWSWQLQTRWQAKHSCSWPMAFWKGKLRKTRASMRQRQPRQPWM